MLHMKRIFGLLILSLLLINCGDDGQDGKAFLSFDWVYAPAWFSDDCPATPSTIRKNSDYQVDAGSYSMMYESWDGSVWSFNYSISINSGTEGSFPFQSGEDGENKYYEINLYSSGPTMYGSIALLQDETALLKTHNETRENGLIFEQTIDKNDYKFDFIKSEYKDIGNSTIILDIYKGKIK